MAQEDRWLLGFNFNVEEWDAKGQTYETLAICRTLALVRRDALGVLVTSLLKPMMRPPMHR